MENTLADEMLDADKNKSESEESSPEDFQEWVFYLQCSSSDHWNSNIIMVAINEFQFR